MISSLKSAPPQDALNSVRYLSILAIKSYFFVGLLYFSDCFLGKDIIPVLIEFKTLKIIGKIKIETTDRTLRVLFLFYAILTFF